MSSPPMDRYARAERALAKTAKTRDAFAKAVAWAKGAGFTERQAPFAASVAGRMKAQKRREVRASEVRRQMLEQWPDLENV